MTVQEAFDNFMLSRQLADLSPKTLYDYQLFVSPLVRHLGADRAITAITQTDIQAYIATLLNRPLSKATRATYIRHCKIFLRWAGKEYKASYDAKTIRVPKSPKRNVHIYTDHEVKQLFGAIKSNADWLEYRNRSIVALMYDSGLRQSEVCGLIWSNVSFSSGLLTVRGKGDKERTVPLGGIAKYYLQKYHAACPYTHDMKDCVFWDTDGNPLTGNAIRLFISRLAAALPFDLSSHKLRHNFATNYCLDQYRQNGQVDIYRLMYLMGHEDISTTRRYLHLANEILASQSCISHLDNIINPTT